MQLERKIFSLISLLCVFAVIAALISQHYFNMQPCAWCVTQRLIYIFIAIVSAGLAILSLRRILASIGSAIIVGVSFTGIAAAWYQENFAAKSFSCAQSFADQLIVKSGLDEALPWLFGIFASCADARVTLLGVEYATWSLLLFGLIGALATVCTARIIRSNRKS